MALHSPLHHYRFQITCFSRSTIFYLLYHSPLFLSNSNFHSFLFHFLFIKLQFYFFSLFTSLDLSFAKESALKMQAEEIIISAFDTSAHKDDTIDRTKICSITSKLSLEYPDLIFLFYYT